MRGTRIAIATLLTLGGCSGGGGTDAGPTADGGDGGLAIAAPAPPAGVTLPTLTPCPDGWRAVDDVTGVTRCEPWPEGGRQECDEDAIHLPGQPGCERLGPACPAGELPDDLPADAIHVRPGASGDGSRASPLGTLEEAITLARGRTGGATIALAEGTYDARVTLPADTTLRGACVAGTVLTWEATERAAVVTADAGNNVIRDLTVADSDGLGIWVEGAGVELRVQDVLVRGVHEGGIVALGGASLVAEHVAVRGVQQISEGFGRGFIVVQDAQVEIRRSEVAGNDGVGISSESSGQVLAEDVVVRDNGPSASDGGTGVSVSSEATAEVRRAAIERNVAAGVLAQYGGVATVSDAVIRETEQDLFEQGGHGLAALAGTVRAERVWVARNRNFGATGSEPGGLLELSDAVVTETQPDGATGVGLVTADEGGAVARRVLIADNTLAGLVATLNATLDARDVTVRDTAAPVEDSFGVGAMLDSSDATLERVAISGSSGFGVSITGGTATLTDLTVRDTGPDREGELGIGLTVREGGEATVRRTRIEGSRGIGMYVWKEGSVATVEDLAVLDTASEASTGKLGQGVHVQSGGVLEGSRVRVARCRSMGIASSGAGSQVRLSELTVERIRPSACAEDTCPEQSGAHGMISITGSTFTAERFRQSEAALCGTFVAEGAILELRRGAVEDNPIGACVQVDGYDVSRLEEGVVFRDNDINLDATELPLPEPAPALPAVSFSLP